MLRRIGSPITLGLIVVALSACSQNATTTPASANAPSASPATPVASNSTKYVKVGALNNVQITAGGSGEAVVHVQIQSGYHTNANPPTDKYLKPTEVIVTPSNGISVGFITYPNPTTKKFSFADHPLSVYEGDAAIKVTLKASPAATQGTHSLAATLNVQACDDQVCYPPGSIDLSIPVTIK